MKTKEILLAIIVLLLVVTLARGNSGAESRTYGYPPAVPPCGMSPLNSNGHPVGCRCQACMHPEHMAMNEHAEYFNDPAAGGSSCALESCSGDFSYALDEFGQPGMTYKDYITSQSVDKSVIENHAAFVKDSLNANGQNLTGRTYALGEVEGTDQTPWIGILGRPQKVPAHGLAAQVPDVDPRAFADKSRMTWSSV